MNTVYRVRASSWSMLFDCAHRYEYQVLQGHRMPSSPRALLGTAVHASTAAFDTSRITGQGLTASDVAGIVVDTIRHPDDDVDWSDSDLSALKAEIIGLTLSTKYCNEVSPSYEFAAVELETKPLIIDCGDGIAIELTGTLDRSRVRKSTGGKGISDLKTGVNAVQKGVAKTKGHAAQVGTYELLYEHTTGEPITEPGEIIGLKTSGSPEIATGQILNAKQVLIGSDKDHGLIEYAAQMFRTGMFYPNPSSHLCGPKYCARWDKCNFKAN